MSVQALDWPARALTESIVTQGTIGGNPAVWPERVAEVRKAAISAAPVASRRMAGAFAPATGKRAMRPANNYAR